VAAIVRAAAKALAIVAAVMLFGFMGLSLLKFEQSTH
jgi:hypothetical protein